MENQDNQSVNKVDQIKALLSGKITKGDSYYVGCENDTIIVRSISDKESLKATHPELHGVLLKYEQRMVGEGHEIWLFLLIPILISALLQINPFIQNGLDLKQYQSWWLYIGLLLIGFMLNNKRLNNRVKKKYGQYKVEIINAINSSGLTVDYVLSMLAKDTSLFNVKTKLMMDE